MASLAHHGTTAKLGGTLVGQAQTHELDTSDEEQEKDKSLRLSDEQLLKLCKGRTAHKGARHGLNMTAKLARVREQELLLLQEWGAADSQVQQDEVQPKKKKRKSSKNKDVQAVTCVDGSEPENCVEHTKKQKSKRKKDEGKDECAAVEDKQETYESNPVKKKKKKHKTEFFCPMMCHHLNTTSCANGNLLYVFVGRAQLGRQVHRDICVLSSAMATIDISCKGCEFDYWEIIAPAVPVEYSELNDT
ncbi:G patch domain-containing protein 4 [Portunus trituberculatus]|uniref:G patch domain-containing protein 4 n=1 Tax=Portunus trituberculatus TaxID=210409 RepID=A0A5B7G1A7_PORTR|nr:G patch domain-containing protein 4 [Portunus trituberculatus]